MTPEELEAERRKSAEALERVTENARAADRARTSEAVLGPKESVVPRPISSEVPEAPAPWNPPAPPDLRPVNESWNKVSGAGGLAALLAGGRKEDTEAQTRFNSDQVQLDNALVAWVSDHFAATHRHYDAAISRMQERLDDVDERHRQLERELVRHVHEMARRIDVVLGEGEKGRVSHETALRALRERLRALEEKLR